MPLGETKRGGAAHRQAGESRFRNAERVHQRERIVKERVEGVAAGRRVSATMAALIVAQYAKAILQRRRLPVPHGERSRERIRKNKPRRALGAVDLVIDGDTVGFDFHSVSSIRQARHPGPASGGPKCKLYAGHPRLSGRTLKAWMAGTSPAMTRQWTSAAKTLPAKR